MAALLTSASALSRSSSVTVGSTLVFEDLQSEPAPVRFRAGEETLLRVIAGLVRLTTDAGERLLDAGEEAIVPAGTTHRLAGANGAARIVTGFRPATR